MSRIKWKINPSEKKDRVRKRKKLLNCISKGVRVHSENFTVILTVNPSGDKRIGVTVSKKSGERGKKEQDKTPFKRILQIK